MKRLKEHIDKKLSGVKMDYVLSDTILDKTVYAQENTVRKKGGIAKKAIAAFCCVALLTSITAVTAASIPSIKEYFENINSNYSNEIVNLNKSVVKDGIELNVISAMNDSRQTTVFFSLRDLTGDRVTEDIHFKEWSGFGEDAGGAGGNPIGFNEETKTLYYKMVAGNGEVIKNDGELVIDGFSSGFKKYDYIEDINLADIINPNPEYEVEDWGDGRITKNLKPGDMNIPIAGGDAVISNVAVIDGKLHMVIMQDEFSSQNNFLNISLIKNPDKIDLDGMDLDIDYGNHQENPMVIDKATGDSIGLIVTDNWGVAFYGNAKVPYSEWVLENHNGYDAYDVDNLGDYTLWTVNEIPTNVFTEKLSVAYPITKAEIMKIENPEDPGMSIEVSPISFTMIDESAYLEYEEYCDECERKAREEAGLDESANVSYTVDKSYTVSIEIALKNGEVISLNENDLHNGYGSKSSYRVNGVYERHYTFINTFDKEINLNDVKSVTYNGKTLYEK